LLLVGSVLAQSLSYAAFLAATILAHTHAQKDALAGFISAIFIARIPILLFQAVQAALLPKLAALAGAGQHDEFRRGMQSGAFIVALTLNQGLIALASYARAATAWAIGIAAFMVPLVFGHELFLRCELAFLVGAVASAAAMAVFLFGRMLGGTTAEISTLMGLIEHEPLEL
jgi:hypothetical protein